MSSTGISSESSCGSSRANPLVIEDSPMQSAVPKFLLPQGSPVKPVSHRRVLQVVYSLCGGIITDTRVFLCGGYKCRMDLDMCQLEFIQVASSYL